MLVHEKSRTRLVTIRLAANEYESLKKACIAERARSVSEYSRAAIMRRVAMRTQKPVQLAEDLTTLGTTLSELDQELRRLSLYISRLMGKESAQSSSA